VSTAANNLLDSVDSKIAQDSDEESADDDQSLDSQSEEEDTLPTPGESTGIQSGENDAGVHASVATKGSADAGVAAFNSDGPVSESAGITTASTLSTTAERKMMPPEGGPVSAADGASTDSTAETASRIADASSEHSDDIGVGQQNKVPVPSAETSTPAHDVVRTSTQAQGQSKTSSSAGTAQLRKQLRKLKKQKEAAIEEAAEVEERLLRRQHFLEAQVKELKGNLEYAQEKVLTNEDEQVCVWFCTLLETAWTPVSIHFMLQQ